MHIWRVENSKGEGCYRKEETEKFLKHHNEDYKKHPTPYLDKKIQRGFKGREICGFKTLLQALEWFSIKDLLLLVKKGYDLKKVDIKEITVYGDKQVLAIK